MALDCDYKYIHENILHKTIDLQYNKIDFLNWQYHINIISNIFSSQILPCQVCHFWFHFYFYFYFYFYIVVLSNSAQMPWEISIFTYHTWTLAQNHNPNEWQRGWQQGGIKTYLLRFFLKVELGSPSLVHITGLVGFLGALLLILILCLHGYLCYRATALHGMSKFSQCAHVHWFA